MQGTRGDSDPLLPKLDPFLRIRYLSRQTAPGQLCNVRVFKALLEQLGVQDSKLLDVLTELAQISLHHVSPSLSNGGQFALVGVADPEKLEQSGFEIERWGHPGFWKPAHECEPIAREWAEKLLDGTFTPRDLDRVRAARNAIVRADEVQAQASRVPSQVAPGAVPGSQSLPESSRVAQASSGNDAAPATASTTLDASTDATMRSSALDSRQDKSTQTTVDKSTQTTVDKSTQTTVDKSTQTTVDESATALANSDATMRSASTPAGLPDLSEPIQLRDSSMLRASTAATEGVSSPGLTAEVISEGSSVSIDREKERELQDFVGQGATVRTAHSGTELGFHVQQTDVRRRQRLTPSAKAEHVRALISVLEGGCDVRDLDLPGPGLSREEMYEGLAELGWIAQMARRIDECMARQGRFATEVDSPIGPSDYEVRRADPPRRGYPFFEAALALLPPGQLPINELDAFIRSSIPTIPPPRTWGMGAGFDRAHGVGDPAGPADTSATPYQRLAADSPQYARSESEISRQGEPSNREGSPAPTGSPKTPTL